MEQFSKVLHELRIWFLANKLIESVYPIRLILLFGGLALIVVSDFSLYYMTYDSIIYKAFNLIFYTIPLFQVAHYAFLLGAWLTLISKDVQLLAIALWIHAALGFFGYISIGGLISVAVYGFLGYLVFVYSKSEFAKTTSEA